MDLPFTREDLLQVFTRFNEEIWPLQVVAIALAGLVVGVAVAGRRTAIADQAISIVLAFFWAVSGIGFHLRHFTSVTPAAHLFGWAFVAGAASLLAAGVAWDSLSFAAPRGWRGGFGALLVGYAAVAYPAIGAVAGHIYPAAPMLGVAPCPTTLFTVGLLLWTRPVAPRIVFVVPFAWSLVGLGAAVELGMVEDFGLLASAVACAAAFLAPPEPAAGRAPAAARP